MGILDDIKNPKPFSTKVITKQDFIDSINKVFGTNFTVKDIFGK